MQDKLIILTTMLFILSLTCERLSNFIKLTLQDVPLIKILVGNLRHQSSKTEDEKKRERGVLITSIIVGIFIAGLLKMDLYHIFINLDTANLSGLIGWNEKITLRTFFSAVPGIIICGIFLSFGSKFWHDLIDMLLQIKNAKRALTDKQTYEIEQADEVAKKLSFSERGIAKEALKKWDDMLQGIAGVGQPYIGTKPVDGKLVYCINVPVSDATDTQLIPPVLSVVLEDGSEYKVPVNIENE